MNDFVESIKKALDERLGNPIVGTYIVSFVVWNWKAVLFLIFGSLKMEDRLDIFPSKLNDNCLLAPVLFAVIYLLAMPWVLYFFEKIVANVMHQRKMLYIEKVGVEKSKEDAILLKQIEIKKKN